MLRTEKVILSTQEICDLTGLSPVTLREWVKRGLVVPSNLGEPGRGRSHFFTPQQSIGLACLAGCHYIARVLDTSFILSTMAAMERLSDDDLRAWINSIRGGWDEERVAAWGARSDLEGLPALDTIDEFLRRVWPTMFRMIQHLQ